MPQKPPRGTTRGPPQLVIPPPPPYPPPDTVDPTVCHREADVTPPTELVPKRMFETTCIYTSVLLMATPRVSFSRLSSLLFKHTRLFFSSLLSFKMPNAV